MIFTKTNIPTEVMEITKDCIVLDHKTERDDPSVCFITYQKGKELHRVLWKKSSGTVIDHYKVA